MPSQRWKISSNFEAKTSQKCPFFFYFSGKSGAKWKSKVLSVLLIIEQSVNKSVWTSCLKASRGIGLSKLNIFRFHQAKRLKEPSRGFDNLKRNVSGAGGNRHRALLAFTKRSDWKNPHEGLIPSSETKVELEGIEPSSKQGNNTLSTCLFRPSFSCGGKTRTTNRRLIP